MDDTLLFIPPCCVNVKLPQAVMQAPRRSLTFYTHSDVTMEKFYRAVSCLVDNAHLMVLAIPYLGSDTVLFLQQCFERGWISDLVLSTLGDYTDIIHRHLSQYADHLLYISHRDATFCASHMVLYNDEKALVLSGPMYDRIRDNALSAYSLMFFSNQQLFSNKHNWGNPIRNAVLPDVIRLRQMALRNGGQLKSPVLDRFIHAEFPPYKN